MGRGDLQLSSAEFWRMTFRELYALLARRHEREDRADFRAGLIAASVLNTMRGKDSDHFFEASDFFPRLAVTAPVPTVIDDAAIDRFWSKATGVFSAFDRRAPA